MMNLKYKRGELTTKQLVTMIILVTSFVILLFLLFKLNLGQITDDQVCKNSIVLQSKNPLNKVFTSLNFDCKTQDLCISGGGDCKGSFDETIPINPDEKNEILKVIADEMFDCWRIFGEGKLDFSLVSSPTTNCAICSRVSFDESIKEEVLYSDLFFFLNGKDKVGTQTYKEFLFPSDPVELEKDWDKILKFFKNQKISFKENYVVVMGINLDVDQDNYLPVHFIKSSRTREIGCEAFDLTKA